MKFRTPVLTLLLAVLGASPAVADNVRVSGKVEVTDSAALEQDEERNPGDFAGNWLVAFEQLRRGTVTNKVQITVANEGVSFTIEPVHKLERVNDLLIAEQRVDGRNLKVVIVPSQIVAMTEIAPK